MNKKYYILIFLIIIGFMSSQAYSKAMNDTSSPSTDRLETATFAGGCFWCMVHPFEDLVGVVSVRSGYAGGHTENPTYKQVSAGGTGHIEAIQLTYDPAQISYEDLLEVYWVNVDPLDDGGQFCDRGETYKSIIFAEGAAQKESAQASKTKLETEAYLGKNLATEIRNFTNFYPAEDYHQDYHKKNPVRYKFYRWNCGRDQRLQKVWGDVSSVDLF